jgi:arsenate reductase
MDMPHALAAFDALGQPSRLTVFRLLVQTGSAGLAAGDIAARLEMKPNTLSTHLGILESAGLIAAQRQGRSIRYFAQMEGLRGLMAWMVQDCCGGNPDACAPLLDLITYKGLKMDPKIYNVLFLCTGNSARSILAEAILNREGKGRFAAYSAGSRPSGQPHPLAISLLQREGIDTAFARSKSWYEFATPDAPKMDFVFTVCDNAAAEECPYWPGQPMTAHWGLPDPAAATGTDAEKALAFAATYAAMLRRIQAFCALPLATIDALSLKSHLKTIGEDIQ